MKEELLVNQMLAEELDDLGKGERVLFANAVAEQLDREEGGEENLVVDLDVLRGGLLAR